MYKITINLDPRMVRAIYIEGVIGAGKSTLCKILTEEYNTQGFNVVLITEPVDEWIKLGSLKEFYEDMQSKAFEFQMTTFITRINKIIRALADKSLEAAKDGISVPDDTLFIIERSIFSDRYFFAENLVEDGMISAEKYELYKTWWNLWEKFVNFSKSGFIYLKPSLTECMDRYTDRGRKDENVPTEYQQRLIDKHNAMFPGESGVTSVHTTNNGTGITKKEMEYLVVEDDGDFRVAGPVRDEILNKINTWILEKNFLSHV